MKKYFIIIMAIMLVFGIISSCVGDPGVQLAKSACDKAYDEGMERAKAEAGDDEIDLAALQVGLEEKRQDCYDNAEK